MVKYTLKKNVDDNFKSSIDSWDLFSMELNQLKKKVFSLNQLKQSWNNGAFSNPEFSKIFRLYRYSQLIFNFLSHVFLKRDFVSYLFHSKIENTKIHLKSRHKLLKALQSGKWLFYLKYFILN